MPPPRRHPELDRYDESFVHPDLRAAGPGAAFREVAEQVLVGPLFSPEFCRKLVAEVDGRPAWEGGLRLKFLQPDAPKEPPGPRDGLLLSRLPGIGETYCEVVSRWLAPRVRSFWTTFELQVYRTPFVRRYMAAGPVPAGRERYWDQSVVSLVVALNDDFEGGGTRFERWGAVPGRRPVGTALVFPGGLSHIRTDEPVTAGRRLDLVGELF